MDNETLIRKFYQSFVNKDVDRMIECYHDNIIFQDPVFGVLKGESARNMWRMLLASGKNNLTITFGNIRGNDTGGSADWQAAYTYGHKKRKVVNRVSAQFEINYHKIIKHNDNFDMWKWTKQAFGLSGYLLGWTSFMQRKIRSHTNSLLNNFIKNNSERNIAVDNKIQ